MSAAAAGAVGAAPALDAAQLRVVRTVAWRFVPLLTVAYLFNYLDRTCLGFAALTMNADLGLSPMQFGNGASSIWSGPRASISARR